MVSALSADRQALTHPTKYYKELLLRTAVYPPTGGWFQPCLLTGRHSLTLPNIVKNFYCERQFIRQPANGFSPVCRQAGTHPSHLLL